MFKKQKAFRFSLASMAATLLLVGIAPLSASASEVNYQTGDSAMDVWNYSGHQTMRGSVVYGYAFTQLLSLKQESAGSGVARGYNEVRISTPSPAFTISMCAWTGAAPGTVFILTCNYLD